MHLVHPDGSQNVQLIPEQTNGGFFLSWSPDGRQIAFTSRRDGNGEIYLLTLADRTLTRLTHGPAADYDPVWSPDGRRIAFLSGVSDATQIMLMDADGSNAAPLLSKPLPFMRNVAWSPDGTLIAFSAEGNLYVVRADGGEPRRLTDAPDSMSELAWAP